MPQGPSGFVLGAPPTAVSVVPRQRPEAVGRGDAVEVLDEVESLLGGRVGDGGLEREPSRDADVDRLAARARPERGVVEHDQPAAHIGPGARGEHVDADRDGALVEAERRKVRPGRVRGVGVDRVQVPAALWIARVRDAVEDRRAREQRVVGGADEPAIAVGVVEHPRVEWVVGAESAPEAGHRNPAQDLAVGLALDHVVAVERRHQLLAADRTVRVRRGFRLLPGQRRVRLGEEARRDVRRRDAQRPRLQACRERELRRFYGVLCALARLGRARRLGAGRDARECAHVDDGGRGDLDRHARVRNVVPGARDLGGKTGKRDSAGQEEGPQKPPPASRSEPHSPKRLTLAARSQGNRLRSAGITRSRALPSPAASRPRTIATGARSSLPMTSSAAPAISSAIAITVERSS